MKKPTPKREPTVTFYLESLNPGSEGKILGESIDHVEVERWRMQMEKMGVKCSEVKSGLLEEISMRVREQKQRDWMRAE